YSLSLLTFYFFNARATTHIYSFSLHDALPICTSGVSIWSWASNDENSEPDLVMACCGDTPTLETLAAVSILRNHFKDLKIRVVRSEEHTSELQSRFDLVCRLLLETKKSYYHKT